MPRKQRDIATGLKSKGFNEDSSGHHIYYILLDADGRKSTIKTKMSHQSGGAEISDNLIGKMARQVKLSTREFLNLVDCPLSREEYLAKIGTDI